MMKFGLRSVILFSLFTGAAIGLYFMELQARKGILIQVERHLPLSNEGIDVPATLTEFRSRHNKREVENSAKGYLHNRMRECQNDFASFNPSYSYTPQLLELYPDELRDAAEAGLGHDSFKAVVDAAWTLLRLGDDRGILLAKRRFIEDREEDRKHFDRLFQLLELHPEIDLESLLVEQIASVAESDSGSGEAAAKLLYHRDITKELLNDRLEKGDVETETLIWLVKNSSSAYVTNAVLKWINASPHPTYRNLELFSTILENPSNDSEFATVKERVELHLVDCFGRADLEKEDRDDCFRILVRHATATSISGLDSILTKCDANDFEVNSLLLLFQLGETSSAKKHFDRLWKKFEPEFDSWTGKQLQHRMLRVGAQIIGPDETLRLCLENKAWKSLAELVEYLRSKEADLKGVELQTNSKIQSQAIKALTNEGEGNASPFIKHWYKQNLSRQKVVDWINLNFAPSVPLTLWRVIYNERYPIDDSLWFTWSRFDRAVDDIHTFLIVALAHSGRGHLAHWEYTHPEGVCDSIEEYADVELNEFQVGASFTEGNYPETCSIVVNDRTYQFDVNEGPNGSDERYDVGAIVDIMNTIAIRQRLRRRFFIYETLPEKGYCLVMFLSPEEARNISSAFDLTPGRGTAHYLEN